MYQPIELKRKFANLNAVKTEDLINMKTEASQHIKRLCEIRQQINAILQTRKPQ